MKIKRRDFVKGCAAACVLLLPGIAGAAMDENASIASTSDGDSRIKTSIKASFGDGFSVQTYRQSNGLTHANIEHFGNRYAVTSADLLDWKIVGAL